MSKAFNKLARTWKGEALKALHTRKQILQLQAKALSRGGSLTENLKLPQWQLPAWSLSCCVVCEVSSDMVDSVAIFLLSLTIWIKHLSARVGKRTAICFENERHGIAYRSRGRTKIYGLMTRVNSNHSQLSLAWGPIHRQPKAGWRPCQMTSSALLKMRFMCNSAWYRDHLHTYEVSLILMAGEIRVFPTRRLTHVGEASGPWKGGNEDSK